MVNYASEQGTRGALEVMVKGDISSGTFNRLIEIILGLHLNEEYFVISFWRQSWGSMHVDVSIEKKRKEKKLLLLSTRIKIYEKTF